jgi:hypothetical protein
MKIMRRRTDEIEEGQVRTNNKMIQEKKQMNLLHLEKLRAIEAQNRVLNDLQKNQVESQQILLLTSNGEGSTDSNLQAKLHTILQQNNFLKGEQDRLSAELAQRTGEIQLVKSNYESTREHMRQQAEQSEERERDVSTLHKDFSRMKINFKDIQSTQAEMSKKLEYTFGLIPTYLAGLQETRGDIDRLAHNIDQEMQEQKIKDHNARELMERQWVQLLKGSQDEMEQRHNNLCSHIGWS